MSEYHWTCPFCNRDTIITKERYCSGYSDLTVDNKEGQKRLISNFIICPNPKCKKFTLSVALHDINLDPWHQPQTGKLLKTWELIPASKAQSFPDYIPKNILSDYLDEVSSDRAIVVALQG